MRGRAASPVAPVESTVKLEPALSRSHRMAESSALVAAQKPNNALTCRTVRKVTKVNKPVF